jgi:hypothetical protein
MTAWTAHITFISEKKKKQTNKTNRYLKKKHTQKTTISTRYKLPAYIDVQIYTLLYCFKKQ